MNIQQRKALEKIVKNSVLKKYDVIRHNQCNERIKIEKDLEAKNKKKAEQIQATRIKLKKEQERLEKEINKLGFQIDSYNRSEELEVRIPTEIDDRLGRKYKQKENELDTLETRLVARVWGIEKDFNSLMKEIETELARV